MRGGGGAYLRGRLAKPVFSRGGGALIGRGALISKFES